MNKVSSIRRTPAFLPHEEAEMREEALKGLIVDHIDGVVAEDLIERTQDLVDSDFWEIV